MVSEFNSIPLLLCAPGTTRLVFALVDTIPASLRSEAGIGGLGTLRCGAKPLKHH